LDLFLFPFLNWVDHDTITEIAANNDCPGHGAKSLQWLPALILMVTPSEGKSKPIGIKGRQLIKSCRARNWCGWDSNSGTI
jgi:hypothetical protein